MGDGVAAAGVEAVEDDRAGEEEADGARWDTQVGVVAAAGVAGSE